MPTLSKTVIGLFNKYKKALMKISKAGDQANPIHLREIASDALTREITWVAPNEPDMIKLIHVTLLNGGSAGIDSKVKHIIDKPFKNKHEVHTEFRKAVPKGRYVLAVTSSHNPNTCIMYDTQLLDRGEN